MFHEPFVLFGYLAALTKLELVPAVIILPQRQTALVAKQAAEVDVLTGGKFRLGVGVGWNEVEYEALDRDFHKRGRIIEEQVEVLRLLWQQEVVSYTGKYHKITEAGLNPLPVRRSIPIWMGGGTDVLLRRVARLADGWFPQGNPDEHMHAMFERLRGYIREAGRDPNSVGLGLASPSPRGISTNSCAAHWHGAILASPISLLTQWVQVSPHRISISRPFVAIKRRLLICKNS
jgi:probable F420-dependent oxidoreductase